MLTRKLKLGRDEGVLGMVVLYRVDRAGLVEKVIPEQNYRK